MKQMLLLGMAVLMLSAANAKELYRAPSGGDAGSYYVLSKSKTGNGFTALTSRIGKGASYTDFTEVQVNCQSRQYRTIKGSGEDGAVDKPTKPLKVYTSGNKWTDLIPGSSKSNLVTFLCK